MTKLTLTADYVGEIYLFNSDIKGSKEYQKMMDEYKPEFIKIYEKNQELYDSAHEEYTENEYTDPYDLQVLLEENAYENKEIMKQAKRPNIMASDGILEVDGKPFPQPKDWKNRDRFWCDEDGGFDLQWNGSYEEKTPIIEEVITHDISIYQFQRFGEGVFELEIDEDFDYMKLTIDLEKNVVFYDGKEFKLIDKGHAQLTEPARWCYLKTEWGIQRDDNYDPVLDENGNEIMKYSHEEIPTKNNIWENLVY